MIRSQHLRLLFLLGLVFLPACWDEEGSNTEALPYDITAIAIDPVNPDIVYIGTGNLASGDLAAGGDGVYKSMDGGMTWRRVVNGLLSFTVQDVVVDLFDPNTVYVATEGGIYRSSNGGEDWGGAPLQGAGTDIVAIVIDRFSCNAPGLPCGTIYTASEADGVRQSTDGGLSWSIMNGGLTEPAVKSLAISPPLYLPGTFPDGCPDPQTCDDIRDVFPFHETVSTLYAGTEEGHVFRFNGQQQIWVEDEPALSDVTNQEVLSLGIDSIVPSPIVYAGLRIEGGGVFNLYRRVGPAWSVVNIPSTVRDSVRIIDFSLFPGENNVNLPTIFVGINGLSKSSEEGVWRPINTGLDRTILSLAIDPVTPTTMYAGSFNSRLFKTLDGGETWFSIEIRL